MPPSPRLLDGSSLSFWAQPGAPAPLRPSDYRPASARGRAGSARMRPSPPAPVQEVRRALPARRRAPRLPPRERTQGAARSARWERWQPARRAGSGLRVATTRRAPQERSWEPSSSPVSRTPRRDAPPVAAERPCAAAPPGVGPPASVEVPDPQGVRHDEQEEAEPAPERRPAARPCGTATGSNACRRATRRRDDRWCRPAAAGETARAHGPFPRALGCASPISRRGCPSEPARSAERSPTGRAPTARDRRASPTAWDDRTSRRRPYRMPVSRRRTCRSDPGPRVSPSAGATTPARRFAFPNLHAPNAGHHRGRGSRAEGLHPHCRRSEDRS